LATLRALFSFQRGSRRNARRQLALIRGKRADAAAAAAYVTAQRRLEHQSLARRADARDRPLPDRRPERVGQPVESAPALRLADAPAGSQLP
jgi:hypothetical protein